jgi:hypothetical protein
MSKITFKKDATIGEIYGPAMEIKDATKAHEYFNAIIKHIMSHGKTQVEATDLAKQNLGYFAGYYNRTTRLRVERLFNCQHPIFGSAEEGEPTPQEAFEIGQKMGKKLNKGN